MNISEFRSYQARVGDGHSQGKGEEELHCPISGETALYVIAMLRPQVIALGRISFDLFSVP